MPDIDPIAAGNTGTATRGKLNEAIAEANKVRADTAVMRPANTSNHLEVADDGGDLAVAFGADGSLLTALISVAARLMVTGQGEVLIGQLNALGRFLVASDGALHTDRVGLTNALDSIFEVGDGRDNPGFRVGNDGSILSALARILGMLRVSPEGRLDTEGFALAPSDYWLFCVSDPMGNVAFGIDAGGTVRMGSAVTTAEDVAEELAPGYGYAVLHMLVYGQSLAVGQTQNTAVSTTQAYDNLMFVRGMIPQYQYDAQSPAVWYGSLVAAVEAPSPSGSAGFTPGLAETPAMGTGDMMKQLMAAEDDLTLAQQSCQIMLSAPGYGAMTLAELSKGSTHFTRLLDQVTAARNLAAAAGKTYGVGAVPLIQGENDYISDTPRARWRKVLDAFVRDLQADARGRAGQAKPIPVVIPQIASHKVAGRAVPQIALEQLKAADEHPLIVLACPMYQFDYQSTSDYHLTAASSRWLGAYLGLAAKRAVMDGAAWQPLAPLAAFRRGRMAVIRMHVPVGPLAWDTTQVSSATNYGFEVIGPDGAALTIASTPTISGDEVRILCSAAIPAGSRVRYAWTGTNNVGRTSGPRGNLRDSQGAALVFDPSGINKRMDNWCAIFEQEL